MFTGKKVLFLVFMLVTLLLSACAGAATPQPAAEAEQPAEEQAAAEPAAEQPAEEQPAEEQAAEPTAAPTEAPAAPEATATPVVNTFASDAPEGDFEVVNLSGWAQAGSTEQFRASNLVAAAEMLNAELEAEGSNVRVQVDAVADSTGWGDFKKKYTLAADAGNAPDIILAGHEDIAPWGNAGYIVPMDECINSQPEFADVIPALWDSTEWQGQRWAVPQDTEARPMFFSKVKLKELGWSDEEIAALPEQIQSGEFTLDDMIALAQEAQEQGVVEPGQGYWHRPSKGGDFLQYYFAHGGELYDEEQDMLVVDREALEQWYAFQREVVEAGITPENFIGTDWSIWHDTVSHGNVLFFNGGIWHWSDWAQNYVADLGGRDYLAETIGYALQPTGIEGEPGVTLSHPLVYMISSESATGQAAQELACRLLAKVTTPELNTEHAVASTHLAILTSQLDYAPYTESEFLSNTSYMTEFAQYQPNHVMFGPYYDILFDNMAAAESGEVTPEQAAENAIQTLQVELGDQVIIR